MVLLGTHNIVKIFLTEFDDRNTCLLVRKRTGSLRRFFWAPTTRINSDFIEIVLLIKHFMHNLLLNEPWHVISNNAALWHV